MIRGGRITFVEFKRPGEQLDPAQDYWRRELLHMGFAHHVIRSIDEFRTLLTLSTG